MNENELKLKFAKLLLSEPEVPFKAASTLFPSDMSKALQVANLWIHDPVVLAEKERLESTEDEESFLPTKAEFARKLWSKMHPDHEYGIAPEEYAKLGKLYADVRGFIEKPEANKTTNTINKVMLVNQSNSDDVWEQSLMQQQQELLKDASNND